MFGDSNDLTQEVNNDIINESFSQINTQLQFIVDYTNPQGLVNSNEGMSENVVMIFKALARALKAIWNSTTTFLTGIFGTIPRLRYYIKQVQEKIEKNQINPQQWKTYLKLDTEISFFSVNDKLPKYPVDLIQRLDDVLLFIDFYLNEYATNGLAVLKNMVYELENFNETDPILSLNELNYEAALLVGRNTPPAFKVTPINDRRFANTYWKVCDLASDKSLFVSKVPLKDASVPIERAESILANTLLITDTKEFHKVQMDRTGEIVCPNVDEVNRFCSLMLTICDKVENYQKLFAEIEKQKEKMLDATEDLVRRIQIGEIESADLPYYKTALRYNSFITATLVQTCAMSSSLAMKVTRAGLVVCNKVLTNID